MLSHEERLSLPGPGPPLLRPSHYIKEFLTHRLEYEGAIFRARCNGPITDPADRRYRKSHPSLRRAAGRSVLAHLHKLLT